MGLGKSGGGPTVGINIGTSLIKVVEARPGKDGPQITALGVAPTPPGAIDNEVIVDPQALGQAIRRLLSESGISCKKCVSSVAGQSSVVVRIIEVPKMTRQELAETMKWEVERHVPFAANEVIMDFQPVERPGADPADQNMEVLLAVAQQEFVNSHIEALFAAGLQPVALDVEPLAACRSLIDLAKDGQEDTIAIVNIGASTTELAVYQHKLLAFPRTLPIAGDAVTRALSDGLHITIEQAERLKRARAAVLLDRAQGTGADIGYAPPEPQDDVENGATIDLSSPTGEAPADDDLGFIPGLGFSFGAPEAETPEAPGLAPSVDAQEDAAPPAGMPFMDFDLSAGEEDVPVSAPTPQFDLSGPAEPVGEDIASVPALAADGDVGEVDTSQLTDEAIFDAMAPVLNDLIAEIRRSIEYYTSRFQSQPDKIFLCGGTSKLRDLDKLIQAELGIPVVLANPLQNVVVFSKSLDQEYLEEVATVFPVGVGLAIRDLIGD